MKKRLLACALALVMALGMLSGGVLAADDRFSDVSASDWYYDAVRFVADSGLMEGTGNGFEPERTISRAMLWTVLARVDGQNAKRSTAPDWYAAAQLWATRKDISDGSDPNGTLTREQLAAMLYRYAQRKGLVRVSPCAELEAFSDAADVSAYAREAMQWAVETGVISGMDGRLSPKSGATRAQVAQILYRLCRTWNLPAQDDASVLLTALLPTEALSQHEHSWGDPMENGNGTHTFTCDCGETKTEYCSFEQVNGIWTCGVCGFAIPEGEAIENWNDLKGAIDDGKTELFLVADIAVEDTLSITADARIYGCNHKLTFASPDMKPRTMFNVAPGKELYLHGLTLDGENEGEAKNGDALIMNRQGHVTAEHCVFENYVGRQIIHSAWYPNAGRVTLVDTAVRNNRLSTDKSSWQYDNTTAATLFWFSGPETFELRNVEITGNTVNAAAAAGGPGNGYLLFAKDGATIVAENLLMRDNEARALFSTYGCDLCHHQFKSGLIEDNAGQFDVYGDLTIGKDMTIDLGSNMMWFTSSSGVRTLTNNGTIIGNIAQHDWSKTDAIYTGTGTHEGTLTGFTKE